MSLTGRVHGLGFMLCWPQYRGFLNQVLQGWSAGALVLGIGHWATDDVQGARVKPSLLTGMSGKINPLKVAGYHGLSLLLAPARQDAVHKHSAGGCMLSLPSMRRNE